MSKGNGFSKFFKGKGKEASLPDSAKSQPAPRSKEEINKQYQDVCTALGDKQVKARGLQQEIDQLFKYVESLGNELDARLKIDGEAARAAESATVATPLGKDEDKNAPVTTGVDAAP